MACGRRAVGLSGSCRLPHACNKQIFYKRTPPVHKSRLMRHNPVACLLCDIRVGSTTTASSQSGLQGILCCFFLVGVSKRGERCSACLILKSALAKRGGCDEQRCSGRQRETKGRRIRRTRELFSDRQRKAVCSGVTCSAGCPAQWSDGFCFSDSCRSTARALLLALCVGTL